MPQAGFKYCTIVRWNREWHLHRKKQFHNLSAPMLPLRWTGSWEDWISIDSPVKCHWEVACFHTDCRLQFLMVKDSVVNRSLPLPEAFNGTTITFSHRPAQVMMRCCIHPPRWDAGFHRSLNGAPSNTEGVSVDWLVFVNKRLRGKRVISATDRAVCEPPSAGSENWKCV